MNKWTRADSFVFNLLVGGGEYLTQRLFCSLSVRVSVASRYQTKLTIRLSSRFTFRAVRGVFPLIFPGVLKTSVKLLLMVSAESSVRGGVGCNSRLTFGEDLCHVFIQPVHLMSNRILDLFHFLVDQL